MSDFGVADQVVQCHTVWFCVTLNYLDINCHEILLKHGADHYVKDNDGISPNEITRWNPRVHLLVGKDNKVNNKEKTKAEETESKSKCKVCKEKDTIKIKKCRSPVGRGECL